MNIFKCLKLPSVLVPFYMPEGSILCYTIIGRIS